MTKIRSHLLPMLLVLAHGVSGCASTTIERTSDLMRYNSTKDVRFGRVEWREWFADGKPKSEFVMDNGDGEASRVNARAWDAVSKLADRVAIPGVLTAGPADARREVDR